MSTVALILLAVGGYLMYQGYRGIHTGKASHPLTTAQGAL